MKNWNPFEIYDFKFNDQQMLSSCKVPSAIRCPACNSRLIVDCTSWTKVDSIWIPDDISLECTRLPDCFEEYEYSDVYRMPYVYWLPLQDRVERWIKRMLRIYFGKEPIPQIWLERNGQLKLPFV